MASLFDLIAKADRIILAQAKYKRLEHNAHHLTAEKEGYALVVGAGSQTTQRSICRFPELVVLDISSKWLRSVRRADLSASYVLADAQLLPFGVETIREVVCTEVLEHIERYDRVLSEIFRIRPVSIYLTFPTNRKEKLLSSLFRGYKDQVGSFHVSMIDPVKLKQTFADSGYAVELSATSAFGIFSYGFILLLLELLRIPYVFHDDGSMIFNRPSPLLSAIVKLGHVVGYLGFLVEFATHIFGIPVLNDSHIVEAWRSEKPLES